MDNWSRFRATIYATGGGTVGLAVWNWLTSGYVDWVNMTYHFAPIDLRALWAGTTALGASAFTALLAVWRGWGKKDDPK